MHIKFDVRLKINLMSEEEENYSAASGEAAPKQQSV